MTGWLAKDLKCESARRFQPGEGSTTGPSVIVKTTLRAASFPALLVRLKRKQPIKEIKGIRGKISGIMTINQLIVLASHA